MVTRETGVKNMQYEGVSLPHLSFIQHSALLSSFPTKPKLLRYSPESSIELYERLYHVTMETFQWHSPLQKQTLTHHFGKAFGVICGTLFWGFRCNSIQLMELTDAADQHLYKRFLKASATVKNNHSCSAFNTQ